MIEPIGLARARAGHDKGRLYVVLAATDRSALLADGKRRKLNRPKRKNQKHVDFLPDSVWNEVSGKLAAQRTDAALRRFLAELETDLRGARESGLRQAKQDKGGT